MRQRLECIDAGSEYCPCYLAETNDCITCSILQGKEFCDCNWRGACIYQEYVWNGNKRKTNRKLFTSKILAKEKINENSYILKLKVTKTLARQLKEPGAYVFLRGEDLPQHFDLPMSIMDTNDIEGYIYVAYQVVGTKTKRLSFCKDNIVVRGPYWNGVFGLKNLKRIADSKCLIIARGIAQAPTILVIKKLIRNNNKVILIVDKGNTDKIIIKDYLKNVNIKIIEENVMTDKGIMQIKSILECNDIKLVYSGGSDLLHLSVLNIIDQHSINPYLVVTNNNEICCGEGVCGACSSYLGDGTAVKTCKTQVDVRKAIERRVFID